MKEKTLAVLCHIGALIGSTFFPGLGGVVAVLVIWAFGKAPDRELLNQHAKEAMNFYISITIYAIIIFFIAVVVFFVGGVLLVGIDPMTMKDHFETIIAPGIIGALIAAMAVSMLIGLAIAIFVIAAIANAIDGKDCHYPLTIRLIK